MAQIVRAASLGGYLECMAALNTDPVPLLREQGLSRQLLANPEHLIPAQAVVRLLERSARASGCRSLGLRMAEGRLLANLGSASLLILHQPSLRHSLEALREFRSRINSTLVLTLDEQQGDAVLREDLTLGAYLSLLCRRNTSGWAALVRLCRAVWAMAGRRARSA